MTSNEEEEESELGKLEYWESCYADELANFESFGDQGEIWFGADVLATMADWTDKLLQARSNHAKDLSLLDLGTGNGTFAVRMAEMGYQSLAGVDYSQASITLAEAIACKAGLPNIRWIKDDLLETGISDRFQVLTDKGTLDAVGLSANAARNRILYRRSIWRLLEPTGLFIVTSCNSTAQELQEEFCRPKTEDEARFRYIDCVKSYPIFRFGGSTGSKVCTLAFAKEG